MLRSSQIRCAGLKPEKTRPCKCRAKTAVLTVTIEATKQQGSFFRPCDDPSSRRDGAQDAVVREKHFVLARRPSPPGKSDLDSAGPRIAQVNRKHLGCGIRQNSFDLADNFQQMRFQGCQSLRGSG